METCEIINLLKDLSHWLSDDQITKNDNMDSQTELNFHTMYHLITVCLFIDENE